MNMGFIHDTHMSQYIPPTAMHFVTGTWTDTAGAVAGTIQLMPPARSHEYQRPDHAPSNSIAQKGALLKSGMTMMSGAFDQRHR
jgi:hypothetical protein